MNLLVFSHRKRGRINPPPEVSEQLLILQCSLCLVLVERILLTGLFFSSIVSYNLEAEQPPLALASSGSRANEVDDDHDADADQDSPFLRPDKRPHLSENLDRNDAYNHRKRETANQEPQHPRLENFLNHNYIPPMLYLCD